MDEVRMVRALYPEPAPPTALEIAQAKALLTEPPRRSLSRPRWGLAGVIAVGAAAAATIALVVANAPAGGNRSAGGSPSAPEGKAPAGQASPDARAAVLAAADRAASQPIGRYWYTDQVQGQSYMVRPATGTYAITGAVTEEFSWWGAKVGSGEAFYERNLPAGPVTSQDAVAWRRAGSPSSFRVWSSDHYASYSATATAWQADHPNPHGGGVFGDGVSAQDLQHLPTDPARLAAMYLSPAALARAGVGPGAGPGAKVAIAAGLLGGAPLPPEVRAGLIRALAAQPGVYAIGTVTDPLGRRGIALASDDKAITINGQFGAPAAEQGTYRAREVLVFDQATGALLAQEEQLTTPGGPYAHRQPGFVINYLAVRSAGWTDTKLAPPAQLPLP